MVGVHKKADNLLTSPVIMGFSARIFCNGLGQIHEKMSYDISDQRKVMCLLASFRMTDSKALEVDRSLNKAFSRSMLKY